ncbi:unnamed protein product, partial [Plutella xylostella]
FKIILSSCFPVVHLGDALCDSSEQVGVFDAQGHGGRVQMGQHFQRHVSFRQTRILCHSLAAVFRHIFHENVIIFTIAVTAVAHWKVFLQFFFSAQRLLESNKYWEDFTEE